MCCELEAPRNGAKQGDGTDYEDVTSFSCDQGFQLVGPERRTCQADGTWTGEPVRCERKYNQKQVLNMTMYACIHSTMWGELYLP